MTLADPVAVHAPTVAERMLRDPKVCPPGTTVAAARRMFDDEHVHALLVVDRGILIAVLVRADLPATAAGGGAVAAGLGALAGRAVGPGADLDTVFEHMRRHRIRRLAVVDDGARLLGLLCLKRSGRGFCSADDVRSRSAAGTAGRPP
ncbi:MULTISPECIES: CBS domain-containing protein [Pseudonocardia]|uniref:Inosine 5'-monophosphate dehydrogenase n=2 Tax=Pseudonocardia TaxID=1847 RepID=A0A1Y2MJM1_PSEAH|nr:MULTISPECIES: CBS domain-containing protein [Pseudonocardia]OSY35486.1 inosine 5'-monophosphate dehydrogenase [Pseudonocardia autotrophica]TDN76962.1 CBS domain-containing protein [Pseudonocardia autotrophica]BBG00966.1 hypothetical protein Pdca_21750 [Pseudonocardia autotrophica]GEC29157.1 hypothetical protein PSA01_61860 [Pseudonocardia saturnea]